MHRKVEKYELEKYASENGYLFKETSVKSNTNVSETFFSLAEYILDKIKNRIITVKEENGIKSGTQFLNGRQCINILDNQRNMTNKCCYI